jgi:hypothetical protein
MSQIPPPTQPGQSTGQAPQGAQQQQQGLPPTGLQQQLASLNSFYSQVQGAGQGMQGMGSLGFNVRQQQFGQAQQQGGGEMEDQSFGSSSLDSMARNLAQRYGMPIGRGRLVDDQGNFLMTPQQMSDASGGAMTLGESAAQMNYIGQAIARRQNEQQQQKGIAAIQTGMGQVQSRGRGSLASMMSGQYEALADIYTNQEYEAADFSYYIQKEQLDIQADLQRRAEKLARQQARGQFVAGVGMTVLGLYTGQYQMAAAGATQAGGSAGATGWF